MSRFNELYHGEPDVAAAQLESGEATTQELCAALSNALRRIGHLEEQVAELRQQERPRSPARKKR